MKRLLDLTQMCEALSISKARYYEMKQVGNKYYDPDLPKPVDVYGDTKIRFYSGDIDAFIEKKLAKMAA